ncbi:DUF2201 family putative metallopeptidase [Rubrivivax sp. RP6-9]|uniref:vWA domain-containing protein n=1 Tax=Rubrivivax sp. RP6-9 TaxID=3415750 RepID=UPI003CC5E298
MTPLHRGEAAVELLVEHAPSTGGLALWVRHADSDDPAAPPAATDGASITYGPGFTALPLAAQAGWVAHEVLHVALRHPQRCVALQALQGDVDLELFNLCADAVVHTTLGHLGWLAQPAGAVALEDLLAQVLGQPQTAEAALLQWDVEALYRAIDDRRPPPVGSGGRQQRPDGPRAAAARALARRSQPDLRPAGQAADAADAADTAPELEAEATRTWRERLLRAHAGDGAFSLLRSLPADLPGTHTPWQQLLRVRLARALSRRLGPAWSRPARSWLANQGRVRSGGSRHRIPWEPGWGAPLAVPRLVVVLDISGSIDAALLARFARELDAITRRLEAGGVLVVGDDAVRAVSRFAPGATGLAGAAFAGSGGTDFTPLLLEADRHGADCIVVLTDLQGPAAHRPQAPVLWAVPEAHAAAVPPFGRLLVLR